MFTEKYDPVKAANLTRAGMLQSRATAVKPPAKKPSKVLGYADDLMSGAAFSPYRAAMQEAAARETANMRANAAAQMKNRGAMGRVIGQSVEDQIRRNRADSMLNEAISEQEMKQQGADLRLKAEGQEADIAYKEGSLDTQRQGLRNDMTRAQMADALSREQIRASAMESSANRATQEQLERERLALQEKLGMGELDLKSELGRGQLDLSREDLALRGELGRAEQERAQRELALREKLGLGELDIRRQELTSQDQRAKDQLALQAELGRGDLDYRNRALSEQSRQAQDQLKLGYAELNAADQYRIKQLAEQGREFDVNNATEMRRLGISESAQKWLQEYQKLSLAEDRYRTDTQSQISREQIASGQRISENQISAQTGISEKELSIKAKALTADPNFPYEFNSETGNWYRKTNQNTGMGWSFSGGR